MKTRPRLVRLKAWLVTGAPARGVAFVVDFSIALSRGMAMATTALTRRLRRRIL